MRVEEESSSEEKKTAARTDNQSVGALSIYLCMRALPIDTTISIPLPPQTDMNMKRALPRTGVPGWLGGGDSSARPKQVSANALHLHLPKYWVRVRRAGE